MNPTIIRGVKFADPGQQRAIDAIVATLIEVSKKAKAAVTQSELVRAGIATQQGGKLKSVSLLNTAEFPHGPRNFRVVGAFVACLLTWEPPQYRGHAHTQVWRSESDDFETAEKIAETSADMFSDVVDYGAAHYYWVRHVNVSGDQGPLHGAGGVLGTTQRELGEVLSDLTEQINESHLAEVLRGRIEAIDTPVTGLLDRVRVLDDPETGVVADIYERIDSLKSASDSLRQEHDLLDLELDSVSDELAETGLAALLRMQELFDDQLQLDGEFRAFRDALISVDPEDGSITLEAIEVLRSELQSQYNSLQMRMSSAEGLISQKASTIELANTTGRVTSAESRLNSMEGELNNKVSSGWFENLVAPVFSSAKTYPKGDRVLQTVNDVVSLWQCHTAVNTPGAWTGAANWTQQDTIAKSLATAQQTLTAHADELSAQAGLVEELAGRVEGAEAAYQNIVDLQVAEDSALLQSLSSAQSVAEGAAAKADDILQLKGEAEGSALASKLSSLETSVGAAKAASDEIINLEVDEASALAQKLSGLESGTEQALARADEAVQLTADEAGSSLAQKSVTLEAVSFQSAEAGLGAILDQLESGHKVRLNRAQLKELTEVVASQHESLVSQLTELQAEFEGNEASFVEFRISQATLLNAISGDYKKLSAYVGVDSAQYESLEEAVADESGAFARSIKQFNVGSEAAPVTLEVAAKAGADVNGKHDALWSVKSQIGELVRGVGFYHKDGDEAGADFYWLADRTVALDPSVLTEANADKTLEEIAAANPGAVSHPFIIADDPNLPGQKAVFINTAMIRAATIQELVSGSVVADEVASTINLLAPRINRDLDITRDSNGKIIEVSDKGKLAGKNFSVDANGNLWANLAELHNLKVYDFNGNLILDSGGVRWDGVTGDNKPADNATNNSIYRQALAPSNGSIDDLWYKTDSKELYRYNGLAWELIGNAFAETSKLTDDAKLGESALWESISGTGKPANNADVTDYTDDRISNSKIDTTWLKNKGALTEQITSANVGTWMSSAAIETLFANKVMSVEVYADKIRGDVLNAGVKDFSSTNKTLSWGTFDVCDYWNNEYVWRTILEFELEASAKQRVVKISSQATLLSAHVHLHNSTRSKTYAKYNNPSSSDDVQFLCACVLPSNFSGKLKLEMTPHFMNTINNNTTRNTVLKEAWIVEVGWLSNELSIAS